MSPSGVFQRFGRPSGLLTIYTVASMKTTERRRNERAKVDCEMAIQIGNDYFSCSVCNVAEGGVLAQPQGGGHTNFKEGDDGICWMEHKNEGFEATFRIARMSGNYIALLFLVLEESQKSFLRKLIAASPR